MVDESMNNPPNPTKERFSQEEAQVVDIKHNVNLLVVALTNHLKLFEENGGCNIKVRSKGRS